MFTNCISSMNYNCQKVLLLKNLKVIALKNRISAQDPHYGHYQILGKGLMQTMIMNTLLFTCQQAKQNKKGRDKCIAYFQFEMARYLNFQCIEYLFAVIGLLYYDREFEKIGLIQEEFNRFIEKDCTYKDKFLHPSFITDLTQNDESFFQLEMSSRTNIQEKDLRNSKKSKFEGEMCQQNTNSNFFDSSQDSILDTSFKFQPTSTTVSILKNLGFEKNPRSNVQTNGQSIDVKDLVGNVVDFSCQMNMFVNWKPNRITLQKNPSRNGNNFQHVADLSIRHVLNRSQVTKFSGHGTGKSQKQARDQSFEKLLRQIFAEMPDVFKDYTMYKYERGISINNK